MGLFKAIIKNVALAAAVIVGKRVWTKVAGSDEKNTSATPVKAPVKAAANPSPSAKPKAAAKPKTAAKPKAPAKTAASSATKPKAAAKPKAPAKPKAATKPKAEVAAEVPAAKPETPAS
jgi:cytoskeletal protein RodZ